MTQTCIKCGAKNDDKSKFCHKCGSKLEKVSNVQSKDKSATNSRSSWLVIALAAIAVIFVILFLAEVNYVGTLQSQIQSSGLSSGSGTNLTAQVNQLESTISSLQSENSQLQGQVSNLQSQNSQLTAQVSNLNVELNNDQSLLNLQVSTTEANQQTINQGSGQTSLVTSFSTPYAGYIVISGTSTASGGYIEVTGAGQSNTEYNFGNGATLDIPVLPGTTGVYYGNPNWFGGATATVSVVYHS